MRHAPNFKTNHIPKCRSSSIDLAMHDIIQKSKRLFNKLENEKNKYEDLTYCDDENKIIAINKILNNKLNNKIL